MSQRAARWIMSSTTLNAVRQMKDDNGRFLFELPPGGAADASDGLLLGKPVITCEVTPSIGASNYPIVAGDFMAGYEMIRIAGVNIVRDHLTVPGKTRFCVWQRFGGRTLDKNAIRAIRTVTS